MEAENSERKTVFFISPHLDDVALSCTKAVSALRRQGFNVHIITLFSTSDNPKRIGNKPWEKVSYEERKKEDLKACEMLVARATHADFLDAPYRHRKFGNFNSLFSSSTEDYPQLIQDLASKIVSLIQEYRPMKIFAPLGIGWHIDHLLTFAAVQKLRVPYPTIEFYYYEDRPYVFTPGAVTLRLTELGFFPATENPKNKVVKIILATVYAYAWVFSRLGLASQPHIFSLLSGFFRVLKRNFRFIRNRNHQAALKLQLDGSVEDLNFAHAVAKCYASQFPYLFGSDETYKNLSLQYAQGLSPNATYSERMWII